MGAKFWVVGGDYLDTHFKEVVAGTTEERYGPYTDYREAHSQWQAKAWQTVDSCTKRYRIVEEREADPPSRFYVVGGDYLDTGFRNLVDGASEERFGPYDSYQAAHAAWQAKAWQSVDSCTKRFRIVEEKSA